MINMRRFIGNVARSDIRSWGKPYPDSAVKNEIYVYELNTY